MTKIAFIGAGSFVFTRNLVRDLLTFPLLQDATIALMDIDPEGPGVCTSRDRTIRRSDAGAGYGVGHHRSTGSA